ncbi:MAG TPA: hypothetical protein VGD98_22635 [Ktedonobacteraceae bacterium]
MTKLLVLQLTYSAWLLGLVGALQYLPVMVFSLFGGMLADRLPRRTMLGRRQRRPGAGKPSG